MVQLEQGGLLNYIENKWGKVKKTSLNNRSKELRFGKLRDSLSSFF